MVEVVCEMEKLSISKRSELASLATSSSMTPRDLGLAGKGKLEFWWFLGLGFRGLGFSRSMSGGRKTSRD